MPPGYELLQLAEEDLRVLIDYTLAVWGRMQAEKYFNELEACFTLLGLQPKLGRACDWIEAGLRRHEHGRHVIFYKITTDGIDIYRVLHQQMVPLRKYFSIEE